MRDILQEARPGSSVYETDGFAEDDERPGTLDPVYHDDPGSGATRSESTDPAATASADKLPPFQRIVIILGLTTLLWLAIAGVLCLLI